MIERAVVEVFGGCNYSCSMCPQTTGRGSDWTRKMPLQLFEKILDELPGKPLIQLEGSGEPTMAKDLPLYVEACSQRGLKSYMYTNGSEFYGDLMKDTLDAGLDFVRFSCIGYNREQYQKWMNVDNFDWIKWNIREVKSYATKCDVSSYHLILNNDQTDYEVSQYKNNFINDLGITGYIWKMHNWSGNWQPKYNRKSDKRRSCGRPFANEITIRAGGVNGLRGAVTPCCQTLGPPNESKSVLGHMSVQSFDDIWYGDEYNNLRKAHEMEEWPDYCQNCDFLIDDPEVLIWTNDADMKVGKMLGVEKINLHEDPYSISKPTNDDYSGSFSRYLYSNM